MYASPKGPILEKEIFQNVLCLLKSPILRRKCALAPQESDFGHNSRFSCICTKSFAFKAFLLGDHFASIKNEFNKLKNVFGSPNLGHVFVKNSKKLHFYPMEMNRFALIEWLHCILIHILVFKHQNVLLAIHGETRFFWKRLMSINFQKSCKLERF